ncbi:MAG TPA: quinolinate synthase NadA, partial [Methanocorpusculum sp.]|nr:quinolinate synthase NadA [Methanocorpusculum sp.]
YMIRRSGEKKEWVILTDKGIIHPLQKKYPHVLFHGIDTAVCPTMKLITEEDLYITLRDGVFPIQVPESIGQRARLAIERMIEASV